MKGIKHYVTNGIKSWKWSDFMEHTLVKNRSDFLKFIDDIRQNELLECIEEIEYFFEFEKKLPSDDMGMMDDDVILNYQYKIGAEPESYPAILISSFDISRDRIGKIEERLFDYVELNEFTNEI